MRIMLKVSGEALKSDDAISTKMLEKVKNDILKIRNKGNEVLVVVGGGNIWRGRENLSIDSVTTNNIGMLATVMNAIALNSYLVNNDIKSKVYSAFEVEGICHKYNYFDALNDVKESVLIFGGGLGIPTFSTDMVTVEKAIELSCDLIIMAKSIDGIYDKDPHQKDAKKYNEITHEMLINNQIKEGIDKLAVMDLEAMSMLCKHKIPLYLFSLKDENGIDKLLDKNYDGTMVRS